MFFISQIFEAEILVFRVHQSKLRGIRVLYPSLACVCRDRFEKPVRILRKKSVTCHSRQCTFQELPQPVVLQQSEFGFLFLWKSSSGLKIRKISAVLHPDTCNVVKLSQSRKTTEWIWMSSPLPAKKRPPLIGQCAPPQFLCKCHGIFATAITADSGRCQILALMACHKARTPEVGEESRKFTI